MIDENKILNSLDKLQKDIDSLKQEITSQKKNGSEEDFKTIVHSVENESEKTPNTGSAKLEGNIETI